MLLDIEIKMFKSRRLREVATIWSMKQNKFQILGEGKNQNGGERGESIVACVFQVEHP